jgi:hypothetical protein
MASPLNYNEHKYRVPLRDLPALAEYLSVALGTAEPYFEGIVESRYFDTLSLLTLDQCKDGAHRKIKFRLRRYNDDGFAQLQIKTKDLFAVRKIKSRGVQWKPYADWNEASLTAEGESGKLIRQIARTYPPLYPVAQIRYRRRRYRIGGCRITLDSEIEAIACDGLKRRIRSAVGLKSAVMETKAPSDASFIPAFLRDRVRRDSFSKFALLTRQLLGETAN